MKPGSEAVGQLDTLSSFEEALESVSRVAGASCKLTITEAKAFLRAQGPSGVNLASRLSRASKVRNAAAHPDGSLAKDILQSSPSLLAPLVGAGDGDAADLALTGGDGDAAAGHAITEVETDAAAGCSGATAEAIYELDAEDAEESETDSTAAAGHANAIAEAATDEPAVAMQQLDRESEVITYNALISACSEGHKVEKALELFVQMQQSGLSPDVITYNALISACEGHQVEKAIELFAEMQWWGLEPNAITYNAPYQCLLKVLRGKEGHGNFC